MSDSVELLLIYAAGYIVAFLLYVIMLLPKLFSYNSTYSNNLRLILVKKHDFGQTGNYFQPEAVSFWNALKEFGFSVLLFLFVSLLSWITVLLSCFVSVWVCVSWLLTPSSVKTYRWKLKNIPFHRAEDLLKHSQEHGFVTTSEQLFAKTLEDFANRSEILTRRYAEWVFGKDREKVEEYVNEARHLTKEVHDSVVIHPRFWAIPQNKDDAEKALYVIRGHR